MQKKINSKKGYKTSFAAWVGNQKVHMSLLKFWTLVQFLFCEIL